jgi:hypothetical protein
MKVVEIAASLKPLLKPVVKATAYFTIAALIVFYLSSEVYD